MASGSETTGLVLPTVTSYTYYIISVAVSTVPKLAVIVSQYMMYTAYNIHSQIATIDV